jgi:outer membrane PBP1 activator LpoA protein
MKIAQKVLICISAVFALGILSGCEKETKENTSKYVLPEGLQDCKVYNMRGEDGSELNVVRCPISSTTATYRSGKTNRTTTTIEAVEQIPTNAPTQVKSKGSDEVEINGETYRKSEAMKEVQINGEVYKKVQ